MKKHYVIEIFLMVIVMGLSGLLIIDYYNLPKRPVLEEEKNKEKEKTEYLLGIGYSLYYELNNYLNEIKPKPENKIEQTENGVTKNCYRIPLIKNELNFLSTEAKKTMNDFIFSRNGNGKINNSTTPAIYCETEKNYIEWIEKKTIAMQEKVARTELNIENYDAEAKILKFNLYIYSTNASEIVKTIPFNVSSIDNEWKIDTFSIE